MVAVAHHLNFIVCLSELTDRARSAIPYVSPMKKFLLIAVFLVFLTGPPCLRAEDWGSRVAATTADLFIARPFTFAATIIGAALWVVTLPITAPTKTHQDALDVMVKTPCQLTFDRELGDFTE